MVSIGREFILKDAAESWAVEITPAAVAKDVVMNLRLFAFMVVIVLGTISNYFGGFSVPFITNFCISDLSGICMF